MTKKVTDTLLRSIEQGLAHGDGTDNWSPAWDKRPSKLLEKNRTASWTKKPEIEKWLRAAKKGMGITVRSDVRWTNCEFAIKSKQVRMAGAARFANSSDWYATLFHELVHATGLPHLNDRAGITYERPPGRSALDREEVQIRMFEEIIAESGSVILCDQFAIDGTQSTTVGNSAEYMCTWLKYDTAADVSEQIKMTVDAMREAVNAVNLLNSYSYISPVTWGVQ